MNTPAQAGFDISLIAETAIDARGQRDLAQLLDSCFPGTFEGRTYFKQLPHARLVLRQDGGVVGQVGLDHRVIRVAADVVRVLGVIDLCVAPHLRRGGRATALLEAAAQVAADANAEFVILFADKPAVYLRNGYRPVEPAVVTWLAVEDRRSCGMQERDFSGTLMARPVAAAAFPRGPIDLLGYLF